MKVAKGVGNRLKICLKVACVAAVAAIIAASEARAVRYDLGGKTLQIMGVVKQSVAYGLAGDQYDTKEGFQSLLSQVILEAKYDLSPYSSFYVSGKYNADQAYAIFSDDDEWEEKQFDESRDRLYTLDDWQDILGEAHLTWVPGNFFVRIGKQIVAWGETDGFRLMDQINPLDQRRGITDVEYENTIVPIWLIRTEYSPPIDSDWLQNINFQFIFNPNFKFRGNAAIEPGNSHAGIWAPMVNIPLGGPYPMDYAHLGSLDKTIEEPSDFSSEGFEFAGRISVVFSDTRMTFNGFYGRENDYVTRNLPVMPGMDVSSYDQRLVFHPAVEGYYPYFRFVGMTMSKDISGLTASSLGGVSPVVRLEAFYAFDTTFANSLNAFEKTDEFRGAAGIDWKVKIPVLNSKSYFSVSPQVYWRRIMDYPGGGVSLTGVEEDNWTTTLMISTNYMHTKLQPSIFWLRDWTNHSQFIRYQVIWDHSSSWKYTIGALFVDGSEEGNGMQPLIHKDHAYFSIAYKF